MSKVKLSMRLKKIAVICLSMLILVPVLSACGMFSTGAKEEEPRTLRIAVMYGDSVNEHVRTEYTDLFEFSRDYLDIEIVSAIDWSSRRYAHYSSDTPNEEPNPHEEMKKLMEGSNPVDLVFFDSYDDYAYFVNENMLASLDPLISRDDFDIDGFVPTVVEGLKAAGSNSLYGLAPRFHSTALIYNKQMFIDAGVPMPQDGMTWEELFELAQRFPNGTDERKTFGFAFRNYNYSDILEDIYFYAAPLELQMFSSDGESILIDTEPWKQVIQRIVKLYEDGILPKQEDLIIQYGPDYVYNPLDHDLFLSGRVAMTVVQHYSYLNEVISANESAHNIEGFNGIEWDVVTLPVHPEKPNVGGQVSMYPIMAINANAANSEDAWELIKFINSKEWAELKSRSSYQLLSRAEYNKPMNGLDYNIDAFFALRPPMPNQDDRRLEQEMRFLWDVRYIGRFKLDQVVNGDMSLDQAIQEWKTEGDAMLKQMKENPDQSPHMILNHTEMVKRAAAAGF